uniref:Cyanocobalamin reductase (cyanide-eliminating) n=1 Tax=Strigamia maritima TaxID=126957 RepID=T1J439_STRMM
MVDIEEKRMLNEISNYWLHRKFEAYPFKIKWYNNAVKPIFHLPYADDTLAFIVLSVPGMFDTTFVPFIRNNQSEIIKDPIDNCMVHEFNKFIEAFPSHEIVVFHDFDLDVKRKARVLVQTAGHVAGAAYFTKRATVHPRYGGWFGFRGVIILKDVMFPNLRQNEPVDSVPFREKKIELLEKFNFQWRDSSYRDVVPVAHRYSEEEKLYFDTLPKDRCKLIDKWRWNNGIMRNLVIWLWIRM